MEDCAARKEGEYQPTASTTITEPLHVEPDEEKLHAQDEGGRQTERHLVPVEDSKPPPDDDFGDFQDDEDFGDFEAAAKEPPAEVVCDRFQRPLAPLSKVTSTIVECTESHAGASRHSTFHTIQRSAHYLRRYAKVEIRRPVLRASRDSVWPRVRRCQKARENARRVSNLPAKSHRPDAHAEVAQSDGRLWRL